MRNGQLKPGQRLEIRPVADAQAESAAQSEWLVSQLLDDPVEGDLMIAAPIDAFRVVGWPVGSQVEIAYIEPLRGIWQLQGKIIEHGISDRVVYYKVRQKGKAKRMQRRTHFRIDCTLEVSWQLEINSDTPETQEDKDNPPLTAYTHDISGGGLQLISDIPVPVNSVLNLQLQAGGKRLVVKGQIVRCYMERTGKEKQYRISIQFIKLRQADQDRLIQTIFELQNQRLAGSQD